MKISFTSLFTVFFSLANLFAYFIFVYLLDVHFLDLRYLIVFLFFYGLSLEIYKNYDVPFIKFSYYLISLWFGVICNSILLFFLLYPFNLDRPIVFYLFIILQVPLFLIELYLAYFPKQKEQEVEIKNLPSAWHRAKLLHLSDIHLGPILNQGFFKKLALKIKKIKPDAIFITGDFFNGQSLDFSWLQQYSELFKTPFGSYFIFGNHDLDFGKQKTINTLKNLNIEILENEMKSVKGLNIIGLESSYRKKIDVGKILSDLNVNKESINLLMLHEPNYINQFKNLGIDLQLSGHTHGGQIFPFNRIIRLFHKYISGFFKFGRYHLLINSGLGTSGPPLRLGTRSEFIIIKLNKI